MAGFSYSGKAAIRWPCGNVTRQYIDYDMATDILTVLCEDTAKDEIEYQGTMADFPAEHIRFLHL